MRRPYRPYRQITEGDVGCHIFFKAFGRKWRANDYDLDYIWPELVGRRVYLVPVCDILLIETDEQLAARLARNAHRSRQRHRPVEELGSSAPAA
jgi:hypothetical protein